VAKDAKTRAKARALFEGGESARSICRTLKLARNTLAEWITSDGWEAGKNEPKLIQKEQDALEKERERIGLTKARVEAKIARRLDAKMAVRITDSGSFSTVPLPAGIEVGEDGTAEAFGMTVQVTDDARTQDKALDQAIEVLGMNKSAADLASGIRSLLDEVLDEA
jgi:ElaB/YqjD/DUF883 family membrane-anchored ribosome-binding protein